MRATPYVLSDVERERSRNKEQKRKKRSVSKNEENKAGRARHQRRRKALAGAAEQEQEWIRSWRLRMSPLVSLWIHAFSTDLRVVSMTCDLLAEQRKRDRERRVKHGCNVDGAHRAAKGKTRNEQCGFRCTFFSASIVVVKSIGAQWGVVLAGPPRS